MPLSDFRLPTTKLRLPGSNDHIVVSGLSFAQIVRLARSQPEMVGLLFAQLKGLDPSNVSEQALTAIGFSLLERVPTFMAEIIVASLQDEPSKYAVDSEGPLLNVAANLPLGFQVEALVAIGKLTVQMEGGLGNFLTTIRTTMGQFNSAMTLPLAN